MTTTKIFTKVSLKRRDLFDNIIQIMLNGGWQLLNSDTSQKYVMKSTGVSGDKKILLELYPFDGSDGIGNAAYDMRNKVRSTIGANGLIRFLTAYDPATNTSTYFTTQYYVLPFLYDRRGDQPNIANSEQVYPDYDLDLYYYCDKDRLMFIIDNWRYTGYPNMFYMIGLPSDAYFQEDYTTIPTNLMMVHSGSGAGWAAGGRPLALERPKNYATKSGKPYMEYCYALIPTLSPNYDSKFVLSECQFGNSDEGIRGRMGGFYMVPRNDDKIVDGDILTINTDTGIQKYKYFVCPFGYSGWTSLMATGIIIRVQ